MKHKKVFVAALAVIVMAVVACVILYNNSDGVRLKRQLDLGHKYLAELNYEEAVVAFNKAIKIDPRNAEAYLGLADVYLGMGDEEAALAALEVGYEATGDERLKAGIDEMQAAAAERAATEEAGRAEAEETSRISKRMEEIRKFLHNEPGQINRQSTDGSTHLLTYDQLEAVYRPLAEELEIYLEQRNGEWEGGAWGDLADIYCHLGEMDKCLETRQRGYEATGWKEYKPEIYMWENGIAYDEYGRAQHEDWTYGEGDRIAIWNHTSEDGTLYHDEFDYDDLGRISVIHRIVTDSDTGEVSTFENSYSYQGDYSVIVTTDCDSFTETEKWIYNEYGEVIDRSEGEYMAKH